MAVNVEYLLYRWSDRVVLHTITENTMDWINEQCEGFKKNRKKVTEISEKRRWLGKFNTHVIYLRQEEKRETVNKFANLLVWRQKKLL